MYGVSEELASIISAICDSTDSNGNQRFSKEICDDFKFRVVSRNLNWPIWWLVNIVAAIESTQPKGHTGSATLNFFWVSENFSKSRFKDAFSGQYEANNINVEYNDKLKIVYCDGEFSLSSSQFPLIVATIELLVSLDPSIYYRFASLGEQPSVSLVDKVSKQLQSEVNQYLAEHTQPQQQQRKCRELINWINEYSGEEYDQGAIRDELILDFWTSAADTSDLDFKLYNNVAESFIDLFHVFEVSASQFHIENSLALGSDIEHGEIDLDRFKEGLIVCNDDFQFLFRLKEGPLSNIKFLSDKDLKILSSVEYAGRSVFRLSLTLARMACFGRHQVSISQFIRKDKVNKLTELVSCVGVMTYQDYIEALSQIKIKLEKTDACIVHILLTHGHIEGAVKLIQRLPEELKRVLRAKLGVDGEEDIASLLLDRSSEMALQFPDLNKLFRGYKSAYDSINREGFKHMPSIEDLEHYIVGLEIVQKAIKLIDGYITIFEKEINTDLLHGRVFNADLGVYKKGFEKLYREWL